MLTQELIIGRRRLTANVALTAEDQIKAINGQPKRNHGNLYCYPAPKTTWIDVSGSDFNTSMGFFDAGGRLMEVIEMMGGNTDLYHFEEETCQFMLQMEENWFKNNNIQPQAEMAFMVKTPIWMIMDSITNMVKMKENSPKRLAPMPVDNLKVSDAK